MVKEVDSRRAPRERARGKNEGQEQEAGWQLLCFWLWADKCGRICPWAEDWVLGRGLGVGEVQFYTRGMLRFSETNA